MTKNKNNRKIPVILSPEEIKTIINQPNKRTPTGLRNKALLSLIWDTGARVSDITNLSPGNIYITKKEVFYKNGKGAVDRWASFSEYTADLLRQYKNQRPKSKYFFCTLEGNKLSRTYIYNMIRRYAKRSNINKKIGPHTLRHSFATDYLKGKDSKLTTLQKILGHKSIKTTSIYLHYDKTDVINGQQAYFRNRDKTKKDQAIDRLARLEGEMNKLRADIAGQ